MRLEGASIEIDPASGLPRILADRPPRVLAEECAAVPPVFSADGKAAFVISAKSGRVVQYRVDLDEARQRSPTRRKGNASCREPAGSAPPVARIAAMACTPGHLATIAWFSCR